jgi:hypothetical protein
MCRRTLEAELGVPRTRALVDRVDDQRTDPDRVAGGQDTGHRIQQQRSAQPLMVVSSIDCQAPKKDYGHWLVAREAAQQSRRRFAGHDRPGRKRVIAGDINIRHSGDEHACATAAMTLESMLAQPLVERWHPAPEALGAVQHLYRDGLLEAHGLVVEHAGRRQQTGKLGNRAGGSIQELDELIPGGLVKAKHAAISEGVLSDHPRRLDNEVGQRLIGLLGR